MGETNKLNMKKNTTNKEIGVNSKEIFLLFAKNRKIKLKKNLSFILPNYKNLTF